MRSESIVKNALFGFSTWILPIALGFVATPIIVGALGNAEYGLYALVLGFIAYSFNFGIGRAITLYVARKRSDKEVLAEEIIPSTLTLNLVVGALGALIIVFSAPWLAADVFDIGAGQSAKTVQAFYIAALIVFLTMVNQVGTSVLQGIQRFDVFSKIFNANSVLVVAGNVVLALSGYGMLWLLSWNCAVLAVTSVIGFVAARRLAPDLRLIPGFSGPALRTIVAYCGWVVLYQLLGNVLLLFERGWIVRELGSEALTYYVVPMMLGLYIHSSLSSLMLVVFPVASENIERREVLEKLYRKATRTACIIVVFVVTSLIVVSKLFLALWMGTEFADAAWTLVVIHAISFGGLALLIVTWQMADGLGYPWYNSILLTICLVISVIGMVLSIKSYGNEGVALSRLAGFGTMLAGIFIAERWFFGAVQVRFWLKSVAVLGSAAAATAIVEFLLVSNLSVSWFSLVLSLILGGAVYLGIVRVSGYLTREDIALARRMLRV